MYKLAKGRQSRMERERNQGPNEIELVARPSLATVVKTETTFSWCILRIVERLSCCFMTPNEGRV